MRNARTKKPASERLRLQWWSTQARFTILSVARGRLVISNTYCLWALFLSKNGGSDNAFTELEYTLYHFDVSQENLWQAMDMFSRFFVNPLLRPEAMERELNAIESEFQLSKNDDGCRFQQLLCHTSGREALEHPFNKFSWGNKQSLKSLPEANGVDVIGEIRRFYQQYYYASNMTLVVIGAYPLDELEEKGT